MGRRDGYRSGGAGLRALLVGLALVTVLAAPRTSEAIQPPQEDPGTTALRTGQYEEAISIFSRRARDVGATPDDHRGLVRALRSVGRYPEAEEAARFFVEANPDSPDLWNSLGEILYSRGDLDARLINTAC